MKVDFTMPGRPQCCAPTQERLFDILCEHPYGMARKELIEKLYANRVDGGPISAEQTIAQTILRLNRRLAKQGFWLRVRGRGPWGWRTQLYLERPARESLAQKKDAA